MPTSTTESASVPVLFTVNVIAVAAANVEVKQVINPHPAFAVTAVVVDVPCVTAISTIFLLYLFWNGTLP